MSRRRWGGWPFSAALALAALAGCASALRPPAPLAATAPSAESLDALLAQADAEYARRAGPGRAAAAEAHYLQAAAADEARVEGLLGAMSAISFRVERGDGDRQALAARATELGQWCQRRAPASAACGYRLAIALGQLARERPATALDALKRMVDLLRAAAAAEPRLDQAGPHRVLALVLLRAPGWPAGPGDAEAGLEEARAAVALFPDAPANQLALAEALEKAGQAAGARAAWERAASLAGALDPEATPEAAAWRQEAARALSRGGAG